MSSLSDFLGEIGRHQLLTPERELTMGRKVQEMVVLVNSCLLYTSPSPRDATLSRMPSSA